MNRIAMTTGIWILAIIAIASTFAAQPYSGKNLHPISRNPLERWDAAFYRSFAEQTHIDRRDAFFPLYGYIVGGVSKIVGTDFDLVSLTLNSLATILSVILLTKILTQFRRMAAMKVWWVVVMLLGLPVSFCLLAPYPAVFVVLAGLSAWWFHERKQPALSILAALIAFFFHPTGIAFLIPTVISLKKGSLRNRLTSLGLIVIAGAIFFWSGLYSRFSEARVGFTTFKGISFIQQGTWYLSHFDSRLSGVTAVAGTIFMVAAALWSLSRLWKKETWLALVTLGLLGVSILTGLWTGLPRFLLPAIILPIALAELRPRYLIPMLAGSLAVQFSWLYFFVTWKLYV